MLILYHLIISTLSTCTGCYHDFGNANIATVNTDTWLEQIVPEQVELSFSNSYPSLHEHSKPPSSSLQI